MNVDIATERAKSTFHVDDVTAVLFGNSGMFLRRQACKDASNNPVYKHAERIPQMQRDEAISKAVELYCLMVQEADHTKYRNLEDGKYAGIYAETAFASAEIPFSLHLGMFVDVLTSQATEEQQKIWLPKAYSHQMIGTYAQTELSHGTFLKGLETTATYDRQREEFILNSPTITSIKYWPGGAGKLMNHAIVMAHLIIDEKNYGMHPFLTQLRDMDSHEPMKGLELGDINMKFGGASVDNGYIRFNNYRIPRDNLLMKFAQVSAAGEYSRQVPPQTLYLGMMSVRLFIVQRAAEFLSRAATIATRYSAVRRQTANADGVEPQILDYQTQQMKLFPAICASYALHFTGISFGQIFEEVKQCVVTGDVSRLAEVHCMGSCLKAYSSEVSSKLIEILRQSCGGHGYSHASGIPNIYLAAIAAVTYEGENTVMYLQCARSLVKFRKVALSGETLPTNLLYLADSTSLPSRLQTATVFSINLYISACRLNLIRQLEKVSISLASISSSMDEAWNSNSVALVSVAKANGLYLTALFFVGRIRNKNWKPEILQVMQEVFEFFVVNNILEDAGSFLQNEVLSRAQIDWMTNRRVELLKLLRPNAVALVDAFDYPDRLLNSCIGRYDGNVYEALYDYAKNSSLNKTQVHSSYHQHIKPMQKALKAKAKL